jgi:hypothetical protein
VTRSTAADVAGYQPWLDDRTAEADTVPLVVPYRARVGVRATLSLILGITGASATLTGVLAPEGVALGTLAFLAGLRGLIAARQRHITGRSLALLGMAGGLAAAVLGVLAIGGHLSWLDSRVDEVSQLHHWLDTMLPWLERW